MKKRGKFFTDSDRVPRNLPGDDVFQVLFGVYALACAVPEYAKGWTPNILAPLCENIFPG